MGTECLRQFPRVFRFWLNRCQIIHSRTRTEQTGAAWSPLFRICTVTVLRAPHLLASLTPVTADEGSVVPSDRYALADVAERIAVTENRLQKLRHRVNRLQEEGSDARDAQ